MNDNTEFEALHTDCERNCFVTCSPKSVNKGAKSEKRLLLKFVPSNSLPDGWPIVTPGVVVLEVLMVPAFWSRTSEATVSWTFMLLKVVPPALVVSHVLIATVGVSHVFDKYT